MTLYHHSTTTLLLFLLIVESLVCTYDTGSFPMIPGTGCGTNMEVNFKQALTEEDDINAMPCTIIRDARSFKKFFTDVVPSKRFDGYASAETKLWVIGLVFSGRSDGTTKVIFKVKTEPFEERA